MRALVTMVALLGLVGCPETPLDTDPTGTDVGDTEVGSDSDTDTSPDTDPGTEPDGTDLDQDGVYTPDDCDDREPEVYPGASEIWDGLDNDCDGTVDGRGVYVGTHQVTANAIVEGQSRSTAVDCVVTLNRAAVVVAFTVSCDVPANDDLARQLLGAVLTVEPVENVATDGRWSGSAEVASDDNWTASGSGSATWSADLQTIALTTRLDSTSLTLRGAGELARQ